jgi:hypothetical protein
LLQKDVAKLLRVPEPSYRNWEPFGDIPGPERQARVAEFLGFDPLAKATMLLALNPRLIAALLG